MENEQANNSGPMDLESENQSLRKDLDTYKYLYQSELEKNQKLTALLEGIQNIIKAFNK